MVAHCLLTYCNGWSDEGARAVMTRYHRLGGWHDKKSVSPRVEAGSVRWRCWHTWLLLQAVRGGSLLWFVRGPLSCVSSHAVPLGWISVSKSLLLWWHRPYWASIPLLSSHEFYHIFTQGHIGRCWGLRPQHICLRAGDTIQLIAGIPSSVKKRGKKI